MGEQAIRRLTATYSGASRAARCALGATLFSAAVIVSLLAPVGTVSADGCDGSKLDAGQLNQIFANPDVGGANGGGSGAGYAGGDYPHAYPLPDGRVLWLFQDIFYSADDDVRDSLTSAAHNGGLVQDGSCFTPFGSPGHNAIGQGATTPMARWFWPLDGEIGYDGALWIFMAEMQNPLRTGAGPGTVPAHTWLARLDPATLQVLSFAPAPDNSADLFGWSVVSDDHYSYLYGHCYRQYINDVIGPGQFDASCMPNSELARVPLGHFDMAPEYWNGTGWTSTPAEVVPVLTRGYANPMSVQWFGDVFVSASKVSDWWGSTIEIDKAASPQGPWQKVQSLSVVADRRCSNCGNYGAFLMPWLDSHGAMTIALANGAPYELWYRNAWLYRPSFYSVPLPSRATTGSAAAAPMFAPVAGTAGFEAVDPRRLVDTRSPDASFGRLEPGVVSVLDLRDSMPAGTQAVALNLAATGTFGDGWVRAYPCNAPVPVTSNLNPTPGGATANAAIVPVGDGRVCFQTLSATDLIVDLAGWLTSTSDVGLNPITPRRLVDTRASLGGSPRLQAGQVLQVQVVDASSTTTAVSLNVTAVDPGADGFITAWPCGTTMPVVANLNPRAGVTRPNAVNVRVGQQGRVCLFTFSDTDLVVDLFGEYQPGAPARYGVVTPTRVLDTRGGFTIRHPSDLSYAVPFGSVVAAQVNATALAGDAGGFVTTYECTSSARPLVANVTYSAGGISGNAALAPVSRGYGCFFPLTTADIVVDLFGVWTTAR